MTFNRPKYRLPVQTVELGQTIVDHTHVLSQDSPSYLQADRIEILPGGRLDHDGYIDFDLTIAEHCGTHIDAPFHFGGPGYLTIDEIPVEDLIGRPAVVDVRDHVIENENYELTVQDLMNWESHYGILPHGSIVIMFSGWQSRWDDPVAYQNIHSGGFNFPGFSIDSLAWLLTNRNIKGIGIDTLSFDHGPSTNYPAHKLLLTSNKWALENLCNLDKISPNNSLMVVSPIKHKGGSGGPARVYTFI